MDAERHGTANVAAAVEDRARREHEDDNDEILPTIFLGQVADWYVEGWRRRQTEPNAFEEAERFAARLAACYPNGERCRAEHDRGRVP
ncbi:hypothetical protein [Saccharopolyspora phatthalungensis]|uniref:Uncharacterized protein n=1 Tax=Saccharopolyspora phatthalungensis TaxID=664693 RepID=A0A840QJX1_9PSEU|nr:hypothetical protein [Saccharopolyspora phatthalungensis]MBB5159539.1 hypothetical protein [Saccharopolyspora phatthalungensis]